jgi:hypothetical protein
MKSKAAAWLVGAALLTALGAQAQDNTPRVDERQKRQRARIKEGRQSGELTRREAARLSAEQQKIRHDEKVAKSDGVVTARERAKLNREQNKASRDIHRQKHDEQTKP